MFSLSRFRPCVFGWNRRFILTPSYLGQDSFQEKRNDLVNTLNKHQMDLIRDRAKQVVKKGFQDKVVLSQDVEKAIFIAKSSSDLAVCASFLRAFVLARPSALHRARHRRLARHLLTLCHLKGEGGLETAAGVVEDEEVMKIMGALDKEGKMMVEGVGLFMTYFQHLYDTGRYPALLDAYLLRRAHSTPNFSSHYQFLGACLRLDTQESLAKATEVVEATKAAEGDLPDRVLCMYALLAVERGRAELANEALAAGSGRMSVQNLNMQIYIYAKLHRFDDALRLINDSLSSLTRHDRPSNTNTQSVFFSEVVMALAIGVRDHGDQDTMRRLADTYADLDQVARVEERTLRGFLTGSVAKRAGGQREVYRRFGGSDNGERTGHKEDYRRKRRDQAKLLE